MKRKPLVSVSHSTLRTPFPLCLCMCRASTYVSIHAFSCLYCLSCFSYIVFTDVYYSVQIYLSPENPNSCHACYASALYTKLSSRFVDFLKVVFCVNIVTRLHCLSFCHIISCNIWLFICKCRRLEAQCKVSHKNEQCQQVQFLFLKLSKSI